MSGLNTPTLPAQPMTRREWEARIVAKAWRDPSFKTLLLADPKAAFQQELGAIDPAIRLPAALQVQVHEETPTTYHLVLPRNPREISLGEVVGDDLLEAVAPQTIAVLLIAVVAGNTVVAGNNVAAVNVAVTANTGVNVNVAAQVNAIGR